MKIGENSPRLYLPDDDLEAEPLVGFIDSNGDPTRIIRNLPLEAVENGSEIFVYLRPERFWQALNEASTRDPPSLWAYHKVTVAFELKYHVDYGLSQSSYPYHKIDLRFLDFDLEPDPVPRPEQQSAGFAGRYELKLVSAPDIRREDRNIEPGAFAKVGDYDRQPSPDPIKVSLSQQAPTRFRRETLLAFEIVPLPVQAGNVAPSIVNAVVSVKFPGGVPNEQLFEICKIFEDRTADDAVEEFWDLTPCAIAPPSPFQIVSDPRVKMHYLLAAMNRYALCLRLDRIGFVIERLLPAQDSKILVEIALHPYPQDSAGAEVHCVEIELEHCDRDLLLVATREGHKAVVFDAHVPFTAAGAPISVKSKEPHLVEVVVVNLSQSTLELAIDPSPQSGPVALERHAAHASTVRIDGPLADISIRRQQVETLIEFRPLVEHRTRIIALDIGTMGMTVAYGWRDDDEMKIAELGRILNLALPADAARREADYERMLPSACGITILEASRLNLPAQCLEHMRLDHRLLLWRSSNEVRADIKNRLEHTLGRIDLHLPLYDRAHEARDPSSIAERGFVPIFSAKPQVCAYETLCLGDLTDRGFYHFLRLRDGGGDVDPLPLRELSTTDLLAAVLDALLVVYLPHAVGSRTETGIDHEFVLTYPASIGADARRRYHAAFTEIVSGMRRAAEAGIPNVPDIRGGYRIHLVPEALSACFALAKCPGLWSKTSAERIRRLVLFDIGAGTVDVSAIEFQREPLVESIEVICQNVSFSLPLGGDVLDRALALDLRPLLSLQGKAPVPEDDPDFLSRIEAGKRLMSTEWFEDRFLPVILTPGCADLTPAKGDTFYGWKPPPNLPSRGNRRQYEWIVMDTGDSSLPSRHPNLDLYLKAIEYLIVAPTMQASGRPEANYAEVQVVMSGRASLFAPLQRAIERGLDLPTEWKARQLKPRLASRILGDDSSGGKRASPNSGSWVARAEAMKSLVARGAGLWSRSEGGKGTAELIPLASHILNHFALLQGSWHGDGFEGDLIDIVQGETTYRVPEGSSLFVVVRPPLLTLSGLPDLFLASDEPKGPFEPDFRYELINRCIRPVVLQTQVNGAHPDDANGPETVAVSKGSPLPFEVRCSSSLIELAPPKSSVELTATCIDRGLGLRAVVTDSAGRRTTRAWSLTSTFTVGGEL